MRKRAILLYTLSLLFSLTSLANQVVVKGIIKFSNGNPAVGREVLVSTDSVSPNTCMVIHKAKTNTNGYFVDTLQCTNRDIRWVVVSVVNCDGALLTKRLEVPASGVVEVSFVLCTPTVCRPEFKWEPLSNTGKAFIFNSSTSYAGPADSIIRRVWTFGDGSANEGNNLSVTHEYAIPGTYQVCLKILTKSGCTNTLCQTVVIQPNIPACKAGFVFEKLPTTSAIGYIAYRFNASISSIAPGDSIVKRIWRFGDGDTLGGNVLNPAHIYKQPGTYEVCLTIFTKYQCQSKFCYVVKVEAPNCKPRVEFAMLSPTTTGLPVQFWSRLADALPGDSIIGRLWRFGDGSVMDGNVVSPVHVYKASGVYEVCLKTKTAHGCYDSVCVKIEVPKPPVPVQCQAYFIWEGNSFSIKFNSKPSAISTTDSIIKRTWYFGDGKSLTGNVVDPTHQYEKAGQYEVCLVIVTKKGCESKLCKIVSVNPTSNAQPCQAYFTFDNSAGGVVKFNSKPSFTTITADSIVARHWNFGNGRTLGGNVVDPKSEYPFGGKFEVCLTIRTAKGCESKICKIIEVRQGQAPYDSSRLWMVKNYPNPVQKEMFVMLYSPKENVEAELAILDVYGVVKWAKKVVVGKGYTNIPVATGFLLPGPYIIRLRSVYGVQSRSFYKIY